MSAKIRIASVLLCTLASVSIAAPSFAVDKNEELTKLTTDTLDTYGAALQARIGNKLTDRQFNIVELKTSAIMQGICQVARHSKKSHFVTEFIACNFDELYNIHH